MTKTILHDKPIIMGLRIDWGKISAESYLRTIPALRKIKTLEFQNNITLFAGENGSGKSTLLEAIAITYGFNPEGGTKNYRFSTFDDTSELHKAMRLIKGITYNTHGYFFRAESFFNVATKTLDYSDSAHPAPRFHEQSHGESFLDFITKWYSKGVYILDEPEAALSAQKQLVLMRYIVEMAKRGSQFIIVSHSPILLGLPDADIISFDNGKIQRCAYEETESYLITKAFVNNRERILENLLANSDS